MKAPRVSEAFGLLAMVIVSSCHGERLVGVGPVQVVEERDGGESFGCAPPGECLETRFEASLQGCVITLASEGSPCVDACLSDATCLAGRCVGTALSCDDANACTVDLCSAERGCASAPLACPPPADPCLRASCDVASGCLTTVVADGTSCGPSDCLAANVCIAGACVKRSVPTSAACAISSLSAGYGHTCATFSSGHTRCWGGNSAGQLGDGTNSNRNVATALGELGLSSVSAGASHSCALAPDGTLRCWGDNAGGDLGDGTAVPQLTPTVASLLPGVVRQVSCGRNTTCVVLASTGGVQCLGTSFYGERGEGSTSIGLSPNDVVGLTSGVVEVSAGWEFTCARTVAGEVSCWGHNTSRQLGGSVGPLSRVPVRVQLDGSASTLAAGGRHACALLHDGRVQCWGSNADGQLGSGGPSNSFGPIDVVGLPHPVTAITAGYWHTCAIAAEQAFCWGSGYVGQLGDGRRQKSFTPVLVNLGAPVRLMAAGGFHSCAALKTGEISCWGSNGLGQVGNGTVLERDAPAQVIVP